MKLYRYLTLTALCALAYGQSQLPDMPKPQMFDRILIVGTGGVQIEDALSTHWMINHGGHETELPSAMAKSLPAMLTFGAAKSYGEYRLAIHHPKLARWVRIADFTGTGFAATRNWFEGSHPTTFHLRKP